MSGDDATRSSDETSPTVEMADAETVAAGGAPDSAAGEPSGRNSPDFASGTRLDRFVILEKLGEGGMGVVLAAYDPDLDRKVAIKLLHPKRMGDDEGRTAQMRLLREAQAMAKLSHPNAVAVHDVGMVGERVFVAMEYVAGGTIKQWIEERPRSWAEIVAMYVHAGRGLAAAHDAGLVHRDFKPENVLVGRDGRVRVSDFGLADTSGTVAVEETDDASQTRPVTLSSKTPLTASLTRTGALLGTPIYMPPEQHQRQKIDARGDQFSFCVALYEGLYSQRPFAGDSYPELADNVIQGAVREPEKDADIPAWVRRILLRGLSRDPDARYPTMHALLAELESDPTAARRRRLAVGATAFGFAALAAIALYAGLRHRSATGVQCDGARHEVARVWDRDARDGMERAFDATGRPYAADTFGRVAEALDSYADDWAQMRRDACEATHVRGTQSDRLLDLRMRCLDRSLAEMAALVRLFGGGMNARVLDRAVAATRELPDLSRCADTEALTAAYPAPADADQRARVDRLEQQLDVAVARDRVGEFRGALEPAKAVAEEARSMDYPPLQAKALALLGRIQHKVGDAEAGEATLVDAARAAALANDDRLLAAAWVNLVWVVGYELGKPAESRGFRAAAEVALERVPDDVDLRAELENGLGSIAYRRGDYQAALQHHERALALREKALGPTHPRVAESLNNIGLVYYELGKSDEALASYERAIAITENALGASHPYIGVFLGNLANVYFDQGDLDKALETQRRALALKERTLGKNHARVAATLTNIGSLLYLQEKPEEARAEQERALAIMESALAEDHPFLAYPLTGLGQCDLALGKPESALPYLERALRIREAKGGSATDIARTRFHLARALWATRKDRNRALKLAREARTAFAAPDAKPQPDLEEIDQWLVSVGADR